MINETGEALMLMSGEHGTLVVEPGDPFPEWYSGEQPAPAEEAPVEDEEDASEEDED